MDPDAMLETAKEGTKAATKLMEIVQKFLGPYWTKKQADADAYADEKKLQTIRENSDMDIVYANGQLNAKLKTPEAFQIRAEIREHHESIRQQANIENVLSQTANELRYSNDDTVSDKPIDEDWIVRFFGIIRDISSQEMQFIWSKILAGEIKKPGSFSLRTLDVIRNLSQSEAIAFKKIVPFIVNNGPIYFILENLKYKEKYKIRHTDFLTLDACGLISLNNSTVYDPKIGKSFQKYIVNDSYIVLARSTSEQEITVTTEIYPLTIVGQELYSILDHPVDEQIMKDLAKSIYDRNSKNSEISVHRLLSMQEEDDIYHYQFEKSPIIQYRDGNQS